MHRGTPVVIDGIGFSAIGRLKFLQLLQRQLETRGIEPEFNSTIASFDDCDLVVAADGANSFVRKTADFGTTVTPLTNKFAWFGTTRVFDTLTQTFVVRLWEAPEPTWGTGEGLRGVVEHVRTGDSVAFGSADALLAFLQTAAGGHTRSTGGAA